MTTAKPPACGHSGVRVNGSPYCHLCNAAKMKDYRKRIFYGLPVRAYRKQILQGAAK